MVTLTFLRRGAGTGFSSRTAELSMPRIQRVAPDGLAHHVLNRGNDRRRVFHKPGDYAAFLRMMRSAQEEAPMRILGYCLMPNHFHLVLWPDCMASLSAYMRLLMNSHVRNYHRHYGTSGRGHIWQGRYKNFPIQTDEHLLTVLRYVEANALRAHLVRRAEDWTWGSLSTCDEGPELTACPVLRPAEWVDYVNDTPPKGELQGVRTSVQRGAPFGDERWQEVTAKAAGLEFTLHRRGRPRKDSRPNPQPCNDLALS
jgi:putative transposase